MRYWPERQGGLSLWGFLDRLMAWECPQRDQVLAIGEEVPEGELSGTGVISWFCRGYRVGWVGLNLSEEPCLISLDHSLVVIMFFAFHVHLIDLFTIRRLIVVIHLVHVLHILIVIFILLLFVNILL